METVKAPSVDIASSEKIDALKREIEKQKGLAENVKSQVTITFRDAQKLCLMQLAQCQQQLKKKDADLLNFAQKVRRQFEWTTAINICQIEQENFLLQKEAEENRRKSTRDVSNVSALRATLLGTKNRPAAQRNG